MPCWPKREAGATKCARRSEDRHTGLGTGRSGLGRLTVGRAGKMSEDAGCESAAPAARASANARARARGGGSPRALIDANSWFELTGVWKHSISSDRIQTRIRELAAEIEAAYPPGEEIHLVCVLKGGFVFMADLVRAMSPRVTMDFIAVSSYAKSTKSSGEVRMLKDLDSGLEGRNVIIVEDIVDTGLTLTYLQEILRARAPRTLQDGLPPEQAVETRGRRHGRVRRLHYRGSFRRRLRPRLCGEVSQSAGCIAAR